ncbi:transporter substrate-binding domain-containing protein [Bermanella marisrubri]|uniref:ABC-type amino acid transport/signal transduction systems, periplasmic component/domain n=1 Tax=Bermanella marisrubri TaxID=207949 RepID=Q1MYK7_9GAMM|nr:transporter substrate-binding domain-containing protein [Bermanella marisrubri]EAT11024.1 ABC-type amino acid transport/signal transduction systems, periplasmic component/domain [Oceanobacter sp. RED65] [Bermanella marisrubri]QIZ82988.1 transporter substrate-binding domain-containing protein [Bermanella marisrubri]
MIKNLIFVGIAVILFSKETHAQPVTLPVFVYHDEAPLHLDSNELDLSQAWAKTMNAQQSQYCFVIQKITRPALNHWVEGESPFMILWANTLWFRSKDTNIKATKPLFWDADVVVSLRDNPVQLQTFDDLIGLRLGARDGHYYKGLEECFSDGRIKRVDSNSSKDNLRSLMNSEIDAYIDSRSSVLFTKQNNAYEQPVYIAGLAHDAFSRHLVVSRDYFELLPFLNQQIEQLKASSEWQSYIQGFAIHRLVDPFELDLKELDQY